MSARSPRVSICLPTWNGARDLARLLPALRAQEVEGGLEIVAVDSSSTDGTRELLEQHGARVETIAQAEFRHGATRNRIAELARGEFLVFMTQDAVPDGTQAIAALVRAFDDERTAGAYARILPGTDDDALTARTALAAPESSDQPLVFERTGAQSTSANSAQRFNNVTSALRASVWRELPFPDVDFGEDSAWAERALAAGWRIRFVPDALVRHAHHYTPRTAFARYKIDAAFQARAHGRLLRPNLWSVAKGIAHEVRADWRFVRREKRPFSALWRSPCLRAAQVWGQYVGGRERDR
ncbi:MAG: glycosyltransferase family 2 protein [Planctomycetes bacterium]|nr:glycosyltransferase family 2 protein [Planctomycetota bacterium]